MFDPPFHAPLLEGQVETWVLAPFQASLLEASVETWVPAPFQAPPLEVLWVLACSVAPAPTAQQGKGMFSNDAVLVLPVLQA